jgi:SAM-dependent methyltransferase
VTNEMRAYFRRQMFYPGLFGVFTNPFYFARKNLVSAISEFSSSINGYLLDVGCGTKPYRSLFKVKHYRGLDIDSPNSRARGVADDLYDGTQFPYTNRAFDSVLCNQVLEHVFNPDEFLTEINRVLKPGGILLLTVPFVWDEHEQPYDYARYTSFGLHALLEKNGFKIIAHKKLAADATVIFQLANAYLFKVSRRWHRLFRFLFTISIIATVNVVGIIAGKLLPDNLDLFLDHALLAEKLS